jgi:opacity protein-like surface antigen
MNRHTEKTLKGVSTIKAGLEFKPDPTVAVRFGYNYVSPMYEKDGFKDTWVNSMGSYHSSTSDFTNWEATHRITCGLGFQLDKWNLAAAYQYSVQNGYFAPFDTDFAFPNVADLVKVNNKRHQVLLTLGYSF